MVGKVPGSASRLREIQRLERCGAQGVVTAAVGFPTPAAKDENHARRVFAHAYACEDGQLLEVWVPHCATCERDCGTVSRSRAKPGWRAPKTQGWQEPERRWLAGGVNLACGGSASRRRRRKLDGTGVTLYKSWSATGSALISLQEWHDSHEAQ